ncbi:AraC-type DNA-binding domain-containing protein [Magnetospirillum sp. XM-1]|uniref:helix-turn-helix domain-containing protein n=1 Tax=Magnetospirillum sp. XM-1 TaxID=1663591 RepID=UPI00073E003C|nr:AraC family transcriptional regulator [Magnetospirillum sp. XM-1]CUW40825.1 AraC-type DNA-binding domain-containing protein [Magnetospirillum sp. XM-1]
MKPGYDSIVLNWLIDPQQSSTEIRAVDRDIECKRAPIPLELGVGWISKYDLPMGMSVLRADYRFNSSATGKLVQTARLEASLPVETLMLHSLSHGRSIQDDHIMKETFSYGVGFDLFRYSQEIAVTPAVDCTFDCLATVLAVGRPALANLLGPTVADRTLVALGLGVAPAVVVRAMPSSVSSILQKAIPNNMTGLMRTLFIQARVLDYLTALIDHLGTNENDAPPVKVATQRARDLHEYLINTYGKLPTLETLAAQFNVSVRTLNNDFRAEYDQPIHTFIAEHRLSEAHAAIEGSDIPLKTLAERLGYSHVNHFLAAFRKKYGYPPGNLRKRQKRELS